MDLEYRKTWDKLVVRLDIVDQEERVKRVQSSSSTKQPLQQHGHRTEYERRQRPGKTIQRKKSVGRYKLDDEDFDSGNQVVHWIMHYPVSSFLILLSHIHSLMEKFSLSFLSRERERDFLERNVT